MATETLTAGTRIYYTGDIANAHGFGEIRTLIEDHRWGASLVVRMDDGRVMHLTPSAFEPGPGRRFMTAAEYKADREAKIAAARAEYAARVGA